MERIAKIPNKELNDAFKKANELDCDYIMFVNRADKGKILASWARYMEGNVVIKITDALKQGETVKINRKEMVR